MTTICVRCEREMTDTAYACTRCGVDKPRGWLEEIADMTPAARDIAYGLSSHSGGGASGKPGSRMPLDLTATAKLDAVQGQVTTWARHVAEERSGRPLAHAGEDPIVHAARYLEANLEWFRHRAEVEEFLTDVEACARVLRGIARGPQDQRYLGPCGAEVEVGHPTCPAGCSCRFDEQTRITETCDSCSCLTRCHGEFAWAGPCSGDVYSRAGATYGTCRTCGTRHDHERRRAWLSDQASEQLADTPIPASVIAFALNINVNTIRTWAHTVRTDNGHVVRAAKLGTFWRDQEGRIVPWVDPEPDWPAAQRAAFTEGRGPRLHYVGDVRELARVAAERRAQREVAMAAESENVA